VGIGTSTNNTIVDNGRGPPNTTFAFLYLLAAHILAEVPLVILKFVVVFIEGQERWLPVFELRGNAFEVCTERKTTAQMVEKIRRRGRKYTGA
jgi:hypothetical protein